MNTNQLSQANVEEELDRFIASKNLELYELVHKKGVPAVYNSLDPKIKTVYKMDALKQFVKNRKKRHSSNSNEKDPLQKAVPRISRAQLLVWELLKQVGKTYDDIFSEWYEASITTPTAPFVLPEKDENEIRLERLEEKIDYLIEKNAVHDRISLKTKYSNLFELTTYLSLLVKTISATSNWTDDDDLLYIHHSLILKLMGKVSKKSEIYKKFFGLYSESNDFNKCMLFIIYQLLLIAYFLNAIADYTDSFKSRFKENGKVFEFEDATDAEDFRKLASDYKKYILKFIDEIQKKRTNFRNGGRACESLYEVFKALFEDSTDLFKDTDGNLAGSKDFNDDMLFSIFLKKPLKEQKYMKIFISKAKKQQIEDVIKWRDKTVQEEFSKHE